VLHKNISRLGSLVTFSVLSVAVYKRLEAGHGKGLFATSVLHKNISRLGSLVTFSVLSVAVYKRLEAGHGK
ncbi:hypothetical protein, partial [Streptococcus pneumoniae]|uniref:hypothetical protein n=1 Tax=Streptococcus pneumoniae TaxID=1313 RepID=UPI0012578C21